MTSPGTFTPAAASSTLNPSASPLSVKIRSLALVTSLTVTSPEFPSVNRRTSVPASSNVQIPEPASRLIAPAASTSTAPSTIKLRFAAAAALSTVVILRTPLVAPAIVTVSLVLGVMTIESSVITVVPIVKSVLASIVVPVMAAAASVPPATVRVLLECVTVTSPLLKFRTPPLATNRSDHIKDVVPNAVPSLVPGERLFSASTISFALLA